MFLRKKHPGSCPFFWRDRFLQRQLEYLQRTGRMEERARGGYFHPGTSRHFLCLLFCSGMQNQLAGRSHTEYPWKRRAKELDADVLIILTAVEKVAINFGKENEQWLSDLTIEEAERYIGEGHFAPGSMLPKVQAAIDFAGSKAGRTAMITLLEKAKDGIMGKTGTQIHK